MARIKRKKLEFTEDSVNEFMQEIYNDTHNIRAKINRLFTKWEARVKEGGEIQAIGDQIVKLIAAEAKNQDQKIMLLKYLKDVVFDRTKSSDNKKSDNDDDEVISSKDRNELISMVKKEMARNK